MTRRQHEKIFQLEVVRLAKLTKWWVYHTYDSRRSEPGFPDLVMIKPPRVIIAELKSEKGKVTPAQERCLSLFRLCPGVETYLWRPSDMDVIIKILRD